MGEVAASLEGLCLGLALALERRGVDGWLPLFCSTWAVEGGGVSRA